MQFYLKHNFGHCTVFLFMINSHQEDSSISKNVQYIRNYVDPLHHAAITGDLESVRHCIEKKKWCPRKLDRHGNNALHNAAKHGQLEVVKYLTGLNKDPTKDEIQTPCKPLVKNRDGLTAQDLASQKGHTHVVSFLLRTTSKQPLLRQDIISPPINIFVVGNSGSGKSTLVKALSSESSILGRMVRVKGVTPLTAGIVPSTISSQVFGKITIMILLAMKNEVIFRQITQPIILVTVDISLSKDVIQKQLLYWLTTLANSIATDTNVFQTIACCCYW